MSRLAKGNKFYKVNFEGQEAKSVLTDSARLAKTIETSNCSNSEDVIREMEKEIKGMIGKGIRGGSSSIC